MEHVCNDLSSNNRIYRSFLRNFDFLRNFEFSGKFLNFKIIFIEFFDFSHNFQFFIKNSNIYIYIIKYPISIIDNSGAPDSKN